MKQSEITFNNVKTAGVKMDQWPIYLTGQQGPDSDGGVVNAVDIDWNEAQLGTAIQGLGEVPDNGALNTATITTTGELIKVIAKQQKQIDALIVMMKALYGTFTTP